MADKYDAPIKAIDDAPKGIFKITPSIAKARGWNIPISMYKKDYTKKDNNSMLRYIHDKGYEIDIGENTIEMTEPMLIIHKN